MNTAVTEHAAQAAVGSDPAPTAGPGRPTLRLATAADQPFLRELFVAVRGPVFSDVPQDVVQSLIDQQYRAQQACFAIHHPDADFHIVEFAGTPIGQIVVDRRASVIKVVDISILPSCRGYHVGTWLLNGLIDESEFRGLPIEVDLAASHPARPWLERYAFGLCGGNSAHLTLVRRPLALSMRTAVLPPARNEESR